LLEINNTRRAKTEAFSVTPSPLEMQGDSLCASVPQDHPCSDCPEAFPHSVIMFSAIYFRVKEGLLVPLVLLVPVVSL